MYFEKIYDTETKGGRGFFSLLIKYEDGYPTSDTRGSNDLGYKNSIYYSDYIKDLSNKGHHHEVFLLQQVFDVKRLKDPGVDNVPENLRTSLACFNGGWTNGNNLETYLNLIVQLSKPENADQHRFYTNWKDQIIDKSITVQSAFAGESFAYENGENPKEKLWRVLINGARGLKKDVAESIITYLLDHIPEYSLLELKEVGIGLHHSLDYFLTRLLNDAGWADLVGEHGGNTEENIKEIAEWVFGEDRHVGNGVLDKLSQPDRGVLGIYDLMLFRLSCSADRGGDIFDLSRALAHHADEKAPTQGDMRVITQEEMREISQKSFGIFKIRYIDTSKNIFDDIEALQINDVAGNYNDYLKTKIEEGVVKKVDVDKKLVELKTRIGSFILYQLANSEINLGAGCGYYDPTGKEDKQMIREIINNYLFDLCFVPSNAKNAEFFIDYLFRNFANAFASAREDGVRYIPSIKEFTKVLDQKKLATFWQKHGATIKALNLERKDKVVFVGGDDEASYKEYLPKLYKVLDDNLSILSEPVTPVV